MAPAALILNPDTEVGQRSVKFRTSATCRRCPQEPDLARAMGSEQCHAGEDLRTEGMQPEFQLRDYPEAASTASQCPEQLRVLVLGGADDPAVPGHEVGGEQVVAGKSVLAFEPARASAERESGGQ